MTNPRMQKEKINVNFQDQSVIQMCPDEEETPYAMISRKVINDDSINPTAKLFLIKILEKKPGWTKYYKNIAHFLEKQDHIYHLDKMINITLSLLEEQNNVPCVQDFINELGKKRMEIE